MTEKRHAVNSKIIRMNEEYSANAKKIQDGASQKRKRAFYRVK